MKDDDEGQSLRQDIIVFPSPCGEVVMKVSPALQVLQICNEWEFPSPCGEVVMKVVII